MLDEGVDDGGPPGSSGSSWGGSNRRRASAAALGSEVAIGELRGLMSTVEWLRRSREKRGRCWCAQLSEWGSPFVGA
jgi:hypothetical protein